MVFYLICIYFVSKIVLPNLKHLQYLLALHQHRNFNRAAQSCYVSQSTLSSAILKLEEQLNCQLIERDHKAFIFTSEGNKVVELARELLVNAHELVNYAQDQSMKGTVRLGCIHTVAPYLLTQLVSLCQQSLPDLQLYLYENSTENLMQLLADGEIDAAILALPVQSHSFHSKVLGQDTFYLAGERQLVQSSLQHNDFSALPPQSVFLLSQEHCLSEHAVTACQLLDPDVIHPFTASSLATLVQMTALHKGVTFLPEMAVNQGVGKNEGLVIEKLPIHMARDIGMLWRKTSLRHSVYTKVSDLIKSLL